MAELLLQAMQAFQSFGSAKDTGRELRGAEAEQFQLRDPNTAVTPHHRGHHPF